MLFYCQHEKAGALEVLQRAGRMLLILRVRISPCMLHLTSR